MANDYTVQAMLERIKLKAFTSTSTSLGDQQICNLANDSLRSYLVPLSLTLREEWWIGKSDIVLVTDGNGQVAVPDSVASSLRTVAWLNAGIQTPLTRIEPENSFQYLATQGSMPVGFELRGYTLQILPKVPNISLYLTAALRPPQMVLDQNAAHIFGISGGLYYTDVVPLAWQAIAPPTVDVISALSPFSTIQAGVVVSALDVPTTRFTLTGLTADSIAALISGNAWLSDPGTSPFANVPIELYPLLEQDVIEVLFQALGDKRLKGVQDRKKELEGFAKRAMAPRAQGNSRPIVNSSAPGMRNAGFWRR